MKEEAITYDAATDTMFIELRPWPENAGSSDATGGQDAGEDLVIHYAPDGQPWAWRSIMLPSIRL
jgi:uncharacterized protein YuzE